MVIAQQRHDKAEKNQFVKADAHIALSAYSIMQSTPALLQPECQVLVSGAFWRQESGLMWCFWHGFLSAVTLLYLAFAVDRKCFLPKDFWVA